MKNLLISCLLVLMLILPLSVACSAPAPTVPAPAIPSPTAPTPATNTPVAPIPVTPAPVAQTIPGSLEHRLDRLVDQLEQQRQTLHVPGMAIAVVKDDELVLAHGFGMANVEKETPVTPETIFAIGSSTKAFTSTVVGMLVDEGTIDWDDPVTKYIPYFQMNIESDNESAEITLRDVLSHRTGFTRMGLLFASGQILIEEVAKQG
jgi:CubicO group peptidase (beta-lactamase class C family)